MTDEDETSPDYWVKTLDRGLAVIRAFSHDSPHLTLAQVAEKAGISRAAARRFLLTLEALRYVEGDPQRRSWTPAPRLLELGFTYLSSKPLPAIAQPHLEALAVEVGATSSMGILDGTDLVYIARATASRLISVSTYVGMRFPAYVPSMGRALLAHLPEAALDKYLEEFHPVPLTSRTISTVDRLREELSAVRTQGWAFEDGEIEDGLRAIAVPVRDRNGKVIAAINVASFGDRIAAADMLGELRAKALLTAKRIEVELPAGVSAI